MTTTSTTRDSATAIVFSGPIFIEATPWKERTMGLTQPIRQEN